MKAVDVRNLTDAELQMKEHNLREEIQRARFRKATGTLTNTAGIGSMKRDLARILGEKHARVVKASNEVVK